jgi:REP element-mobilizing transposase RayT
MQKRKRRRRALPRQIGLFERGTWGGARPHAGRKKAAFRKSVAHVVRPEISARHPLHVTMRSRARTLRRGHVLTALRRQVKRVREAEGGFRILHYSLQDNHLHLLVEADDKATLSSGMIGFASALGRSINKLRRVHGKIWSQRYHARALKSPLEVRRALIYVLRNGSKHGVARGEDRYSSARAFDGFVATRAVGDDCLAEGQTWLVRVGWRKAHGAIRAHERPKAPPAPGVVIWDYLATA